MFCIRRISACESSTTRIFFNMPAPPDSSPKKELQVGGHVPREILALRTSRQLPVAPVLRRYSCLRMPRIPDDENPLAYQLETLSHQPAFRRPAMRIAA